MFIEGRIRLHLLKNTRYSVVFCGLQYLGTASNKVRDCTDLVVHRSLFTDANTSGGSCPISGLESSTLKVNWFLKKEPPTPKIHHKKTPWTESKQE